MARRSNIEQGFYRKGKFHPVRKSNDYDAVRGKDAVASFASKARPKTNPTAKVTVQADRDRGGKRTWAVVVDGKLRDWFYTRAKADELAAQLKRRNPADAAAALSEAFHGRPAETVTEYVEELHEHSTLAELGDALSVKLADGTLIKFSGVKLASNEQGTQLFLVGGDQSVDLAAFPRVDQTKETVVLGKVKHLDYETAKFHLGKEDRKAGPYTHRLGEETGVMPYLMYDTVNERLSFAGGAYHIDIDMDGKYSAGIRD